MVVAPGDPEPHVRTIAPSPRPARAPRILFCGCHSGVTPAPSALLPHRTTITLTGGLIADHLRLPRPRCLGYWGPTELYSPLWLTPPPLARMPSDLNQTRERRVGGTMSRVSHDQQCESLSQVTARPLGE